MRPKVTFAVLILGLVTLVLLTYLRPKRAGTQSAHSTLPQVLNKGDLASSGSTNTVLAGFAKTGSNSTVEAKALSAKGENASVGGEDSTASNHSAYVETRVGELMDLAMGHEPGSLETILSELNNRDPAIRKAALEAAVQFGSRDAIPKLTDAASQTDDPEEKVAIKEAIEFLSVPSLFGKRGTGTKSGVRPSQTPATAKPIQRNWAKRLPPAATPPQ